MESPSVSTCDPSVEVSAFTIDRKIVRKDIAKEVNKTLRREVKETLTEAFLPLWVVDRVHEFTADWYPFVKDGSQPHSAKKIGRGITEKLSSNENTSNSYVVNLFGLLPSDISERLQDFYLVLEQDLRISGTSFLGRGRESFSDADVEKHGKEDVLGDERRVREKMDNEAKIKEAVDAVERTICTLFYDRYAFP